MLCNGLGPSVRGRAAQWKSDLWSWVWSFHRCVPRGKGKPVWFFSVQGFRRWCGGWHAVGKATSGRGFDCCTDACHVARANLFGSFLFKGSGDGAGVGTQLEKRPVEQKLHFTASTSHPVGIQSASMDADWTEMYPVEKMHADLLSYILHAAVTPASSNRVARAWGGAREVPVVERVVELHGVPKHSGHDLHLGRFQTSPSSCSRFQCSTCLARGQTTPRL